MPDLTFRIVGDGAPMLLLHGAAEDVGMLAPQAEAFAARGRRVIWYDRRGTGTSSREGWPDGGIEQHADDAADLLRHLDAAPAQVVGFSSGGVVGMALAVRHPEVVSRMVAWEPPAIGVLPDGAALHAAISAPIEAHLAARPDDWTGAYAVMLQVLSEGRADLDSPAVRLQMVNAEPALRDDARVITRHVFAAGELRTARITVAVGKGTDPVHAMIAAEIERQTGRPTLVVDEADDHEVYLTRPEVLAAALVPDPAGVG
jgi:pimeloyl-ACP methyl ester carboxylesterase